MMSLNTTSSTTLSTDPREQICNGWSYAPWHSSTTSRLISLDPCSRLVGRSFFAGSHYSWYLSRILGSLVRKHFCTRMSTSIELFLWQAMSYHMMKWRGSSRGSLGRMSLLLTGSLLDCWCGRLRNWGLCFDGFMTRGIKPMFEHCENYIQVWRTLSRDWRRKVGSCPSSRRVCSGLYCVGL